METYSFYNLLAHCTSNMEADRRRGFESCRIAGFRIGVAACKSDFRDCCVLGMMVVVVAAAAVAAVDFDVGN